MPAGETDRIRVLHCGIVLLSRLENTRSTNYPLRHIRQTDASTGTLTGSRGSISEAVRF